MFYVGGYLSECVCLYSYKGVCVHLAVSACVCETQWVGNWAHFNSRWSTGAEKVPWTRRVCLIGRATVPLRKFSAQRLMFHCSWGKLIQQNITHNSPPTVHNRGGGCHGDCTKNLYSIFHQCLCFLSGFPFLVFISSLPSPYNAMISSSIVHFVVLLFLFLICVDTLGRKSAEKAGKNNAEHKFKNVNDSIIMHS